MEGRGCVRQVGGNRWGKAYLSHVQLQLEGGLYGVAMTMGVGGVNREWVVNKTGSKPKR